MPYLDYRDAAKIRHMVQDLHRNYSLRRKTLYADQWMAIMRYCLSLPGGHGKQACQYADNYLQQLRLDKRPLHQICWN